MAKFIPLATPHLSGNEKKYVMDCIDTTWISSNGKYISEFESAFAKWIGSKHALTCCNGTVALHLSLLALGVQAGDEILVPTFTYIATVNAVRYCGATPVLVDCLPDTWNIDPGDMERKITSRTKGIIPVHLYGNPCEMDTIMSIAQKHTLFVLEDAAECHGAQFNGRKVGTFGDTGVFSFIGNKIITTGEGGMVITDNDDLAAKMRLFNEAAIGLAQLENVEEHIAARHRVASWYSEFLNGMADYFIPQKQTVGATSVWWMYSGLLTKKSKISRDALMTALASDGIETRPLFYPMHIMPPFYDENAGCPVSEDISARGMNLPTHALLTREDVEYICQHLKKHIID